MKYKRNNYFNFWYIFIFFLIYFKVLSYACDIKVCQKDLTYYDYNKTNESPSILTSPTEFYLNESFYTTFEEHLTDQNKEDPPVFHYIIKIPDEYKTSNNTLKEIHNMGLKCLADSHSPYGTPTIEFDEDYEKRKKHFEELKEKTEKYRKTPLHCYAKYCGEWIEDVWINTFINESIETFGPYIPIFVPWLNIFKYHQLRAYPYQKVLKEIFALIKPEYLYITVSMSSFGIEGSKPLMHGVPNNIIMLTPATRGHVPIPHLKSIQQVQDIEPEKYVASFIGNDMYLERKQAIKYFSSKYKSKFYSSGHIKDWNEINRVSRVVLSPRGFAIGCWRTYELLQMGFIPVIIYRRAPWLPYKDSGIPWNNMIIIGSRNELNEIDKQIESIDEERRLFMRKTILEHRHLFTYHGVMEQIALFMQGRGYLRCDTYHRHLTV